MQKIQMTEKQAREIIDVIFGVNNRGKDISLYNLNQCGYICKSELQTLVDEAEEAYREFIETINETNAVYAMNKYRLLCEALKKSHPEFE
jgi:hypothetical protein